MTGAAGTEALTRRIDELAAARLSANERFFAAEADRLARCCHAMAERFARGGRLIAVGHSPVARSDARHVAVEFVHPVIVGKRALPAIGLAGEGGDLAPQLEAFAEGDDIVIAFVADAEDEGQARDAVTSARELGCQTIAFAPVGAEWEFEVGADDEFVEQEVAETLYHVLWELVHVYFDHRGLLEGRETRPVHDTGGSSFLYPFLSESEHDLDSITADVRGSVLMKAEEIGALREATLGENREGLIQAATALRARLDAGGRLMAFGNGGSATDAMDAVADYRRPPHGWPSRPALDLTEDSSILTAIANDVGVEEIFQRQVIAHGREGDVALALSTSGGSDNVILALAEARRRGMLTIALVGYDGGRIADEGLADHVIVTRSQHIPRIQEAQASAHHVLRELVELVEPT
ncbi:MAG: SIS domain-containing protein [Solirubrobacterales bacterium]